MAGKRHEIWYNAYVRLTASRLHFMKEESPGSKGQGSC
jgi:hypothetical protein